MKRLRSFIALPPILILCGIGMLGCLCALPAVERWAARELHKINKELAK